ncbi:PAS domain-containing hybrid sensor histidine kinase/response regulator [uncultured Shewanella sp.]|uniref:PAS domain-containing hybrid sensor histidine kinase/response regulator n=1 Tax=uncultured Shewanella sp. TaxID=173975 RepID=UPI002625A806|nr:PAS domain-containing hybrid sensor histidine kinase/response regulator [uncultured Shewanella sp.]
MKAHHHKIISGLLITAATVLLMSLALLITRTHLIKQYHHAYVDLTHQVLSVRDDVFKFQVGNQQNYDAISQALLQSELQVAQIQASLSEKNLHAIAYFLIGGKSIEIENQHLAKAVSQLISELETLLRLMISQEYSDHTITLLQQNLLNNHSNIQDQLQILSLLNGTKNTQAVTPSLINDNTYTSLNNHLKLANKVNLNIDEKNINILNNQVRHLLENNTVSWLKKTEETKQAIFITILLLTLTLFSYYFLQFRLRAQKELGIQQTLAKIEQEKHQLALVAEHAQDAIIITDKHGRVTWVNQGFTILSGYSLNDMLNRKPGEILQGCDTDKREIEQLSQAIKQKKPIETEIINYHKNGAPYWIDIAITPIFNKKEQLINYIAVERNCSDRKKMQAELAQAVKKADASNAAKSTFLATMSHELRTPLNGILGMAQIVESNLTEPTQRKQLQILLESGNHLTALLNDILDFSKIEQNKLELENELFGFNNVIDPIINTYGPICDEKNIKFIVNNDINEKQAFKGDKARIRQVIYNLLSNSVKFTHEGSITLTFNQTTRQNNAGVNITLSDTGIGIRQERLDTIFNPFIQAESSTTRQYGGTGLGLSIVKQLVELMQGHISISSEVGSGTTFDIFIAIKQSDQPLPQIHKQKELIKDLPKNLSILIAEDNKINALVAKTFCQRLGHNATIANNGLEAVNQLKENDFDLIIMDNHMPEMDGIEATKAIRQELKKNTPIFACTADVFQEAHDSFIEAGANHVLTKPLQEQSFMDALHQHAGLITHHNRTDNQQPNQVLNEKDKTAPTSDTAHIIALSRHIKSQLNLTEAEIKLKHLQSISQAHHMPLNTLIKAFQSSAEKMISEIIQSVENKDVHKIYLISQHIHALATEYQLPRILKQIRILSSDSLKNQLPALEPMQHLINLLEVNIHQARRFISKSPMKKNKDADG